MGRMWERNTKVYLQFWAANLCINKPEYIMGDLTYIQDVLLFRNKLIEYQNPLLETESRVVSMRWEVF